MRRIEELSHVLRVGGRSSRERESSLIGPATCLLGGLGGMLLGFAAVLELFPQGPVARLAVVFSAALPFGG